MADTTTPAGSETATSTTTSTTSASASDTPAATTTTTSASETQTPAATTTTTTDTGTATPAAPAETQTSASSATPVPTTSGSSATPTPTASSDTPTPTPAATPVVQGLELIGSPQTAYLGEAFSWTPEVTGGAGDKPKITLTSGMIPNGMTIVDGVIAGIATDTNTYNFQLTVADSKFTIAQNYTIAPIKRVPPTLDETLVGMDLTFYIAEKSYEVEAGLLKGAGSTQLTNILVNMTRLLLADPTAYKLQAMLDFHKKYAATSLSETQAFIEAPLAVKSIRSVYTAYRSIAVGPKLSSYDFIVADTGCKALATFLQNQ